MEGREAFYDNISFKVRVESRVSFLEQRWCQNIVLKNDFLVLYRVSCQRDGGQKGMGLFGI